MVEGAQFDIMARLKAMAAPCTCGMKKIAVAAGQAMPGLCPGLFAAGRRPCVKSGSTPGCIPYFG